MSALFVPPVGSGSTSLTGDLSPLGTLFFGFGYPPAPPFPPPLKWRYVGHRFDLLLDNLSTTEVQRKDGETKQAGVRACLNRAYYGHSSETANSFLVGSWGKDTRVRPPRDVDLLFLLPPEVYWQFEGRSGNRQSQLLQEVKAVLSAMYPRTAMRGDGQVVVVPFDTTAIEVAPGFRCQDGSIITCDTNGGGMYKVSTAEAELAELAASDAACNGNTRNLVRMMKAWQRERNVPLKSFCLERLAVEFLAVWPHARMGRFYYDWMVRDFLRYLVGRAGGFLFMPRTGEQVGLGYDWLSRAETAYRHAVAACECEQGNYGALAGSEWREIFGSVVPVLVS